MVYDVRVSWRLAREARITLGRELSGFHAVSIWGAAVVLCCISALATAQQEQDPSRWTTTNKDYSSQRYVDLDQMTTGNVKNLKEVCEVRLNEPSWFSSGILTVDRTLYVTTLRATYAVDAVTCEPRWREMIQLGPRANMSNRGPAYYNGMIFRGTADGRVIAMNAKNGKVIWDKTYANPSIGETFVAAPIVWKDKVFIGIAISDLGIRGRLIALRANNGEKIWTFHTVALSAKAPVEGKAKGGGFWTTFSLDPERGEVLAPVGNPYDDFDNTDRPGDNIYTDSVIAVDAATGKLKWYYQHTPADDHDWDVGSAPTLYRSRAGKEMLAVAGKDGWVSGVDRSSHKQIFKADGTTIANHGLLPSKLKRVCPGVSGGSQFNGAAYHPGIGALYVGEVDWCTYYVDPKGPVKLEVGEEGGTTLSAAAMSPPQGKNAGLESPVFFDFTQQPKGVITAIDGDTGGILWRYPTDAQMLAGLVPTKGGLVFAGDVRGNLFAFDAKTGIVLKHIDAGGALNGGLISYAVDATQYVAVAVGGVTLNARGVSGPLALKIYGLQVEGLPQVKTFDRESTQEREAKAAGEELFGRICTACHGVTGEGRVFPSIKRLTEMGDVSVLKRFLANVPPPMPILYPGLLTDDEVGLIADFIKTKVVDGSGPHSGYIQPTSAGTPEWQQIYSVMTFPRCINCHTTPVDEQKPEETYPRQTDDRYPHVFRVVRGQDDRGVEMKRCTGCHGLRNDPVTGIPGREDWRLAPLTMTTEAKPGVAKSGPQLCADLKDPEKNGNHSLQELLHHVDVDGFVIWGWDPGARPNGNPRTTPPVASHSEFVRIFEQWIKDGAPCPKQ